MRIGCLLIGAMVANGPCVLGAEGAAMTSSLTDATEPSFEVASIRIVDDPSRHTYGVHVGPDRWRATNVALTTLVERAYGLPPSRIVGMPAWGTDVCFDIDARSPAAVPPEQMRLMLRTLLRDRFGLRARMESGELPVYLLSVSKPEGPGPGLRPSTLDCGPYRAEVSEWSRLRTGPPPHRRQECETRTERRDGTVVIAQRGSPIDVLVAFLSSWVERPVIDRTGLNGLFDFEIEVGQDEIPLFRLQRPAGSPPSGGPSLSSALEGQLGLVLEAGRAPVDVLAIESVQRVPTPN